MPQKGAFKQIDYEHLQTFMVLSEWLTLSFGPLKKKKKNLALRGPEIRGV